MRPFPFATTISVLIGLGGLGAQQMLTGSEYAWLWPYLTYGGFGAAAVVLLGGACIHLFGKKKPEPVRAGQTANGGSALIGRDNSGLVNSGTMNVFGRLTVEGVSPPQPIQGQISVVDVVKADGDDYRRPGSVRVFVRVVVAAGTDVELSNCTGRLIQVSRLDDDGWLPIWFGSTPCWWADGRAREKIETDIRPGISHYLNVVSAKQSVNTLRLIAETTVEEPKLVVLLKEQASFRFDVAISAKGVQTTKYSFEIAAARSTYEMEPEAVR
jgi:hypothetical protein